MPVITPDDVANWLGQPFPNDQIETATAAAVKWTEDRRSLTDPTDLWEEADVHLGAVMYAGLLYLQRGQPQGLSGNDEMGTYSEDTGMAMVQIFRLVGSDPVVW